MFQGERALIGGATNQKRHEVEEQERLDPAHVLRYWFSVGEIRRDGGWPPFASEKQAREYSTEIYSAYATKQCADCIRKQD